MLVDISRWQEAARAHGKFFGDVRPASTFVEVSRFIDADWLVEIEADAVVKRAIGGKIFVAEGFEGPKNQTAR
jgi:enamine deaminase RidA (YjgF/YER057c/UK114 family)